MFVVSSDWDFDALTTEAGAVTWGNGSTGISGAVGTSNSLVARMESASAIGGREHQLPPIKSLSYLMEIISSSVLIGMAAEAVLERLPGLMAPLAISQLDLMAPWSMPRIHWWAPATMTG